MSFNLSNHYQTAPDTNQHRSKTGTSTTAAAGRFNRISNPNDLGIRVFKTVEQHVIISELGSRDDSGDLPYYGTKQGTTTVKIDETGSDIELIPWPEAEEKQ